MAVFEVESWYIAEGKEEEHDEAMRDWLQWVNNHRELFQEWKSVRYLEKSIAGEDSGRLFVIWEYDSMSDFEAYKKRRGDYTGPYEEYKEHDPYYKGVFIHSSMTVEFWAEKERELWME